MALCSKYQVKLPEKGIIAKKGRKYPYVYHVDSYYRKAKGTPSHKKRSIGKYDAQTGMLIPNQNYYEIYGSQNETKKEEETEIKCGEIREIGVVCVVEGVFEKLGVRKILRTIIGENRYEKIKTIVTYMLCEGNVMQYIDDFCENTVYNKGMTDREVSLFFASLTNNERMRFFKEWVALRSQNEYIAYDVTSFSTYAKNIDDAEYGYNRDKESLPQINMAMYMGQTSLLPMFYVTYDGSIVDKSHLEYMMTYNAELGIENVSFVMDRGFASTDNAEYMRGKGYPFILGAGYNIKAIRQAFAENKQSVQNAGNYILSQKVYGTAVKGRFYRIDATLHIFYDPESIPQQTADFFRKIAAEENELSQLKNLDDAQRQKYSKHFIITKAKNGFTFERDNTKINDIHGRLGYFFILTNKSLSSEDVVSIYRKRDVIEKGFDEIKNGLDMNRLRTHSSATTDGKMFCAFLSLICRLYMQNNLLDLIDELNFSNERVIRELSKIRAIDLDGKKRLLNPLTKIQKDILIALHLNLDIVPDYFILLNL